MGFASSGPAVWQLWHGFALSERAQQISTSGRSRWKGGIKVAACFSTSNAFLDARMLAMS
jgi:hypothetical protein